MHMCLRLALSLSSVPVMACNGCSVCREPACFSSLNVSVVHRQDVMLALHNYSRSAYIEQANQKVIKTWLRLVYIYNNGDSSSPKMISLKAIHIGSQGINLIVYTQCRMCTVHCSWKTWLPLAVCIATFYKTVVDQFATLILV